MQIQSVIFTNFRSYIGEHSFILNKGVHQVCGTNGAGKSTIFEAIVYGIFGRTFKKSSNVINSGQKFMATVVNLQVGGKSVVVRRTEFRNDRNNYVLEVDGEETQFSKKADFDNKVEALLGVSYDVFVNSVIVPQRATSLLYASSAVQRALIEELFDFSWIDKAKEKASKQLAIISSKMQENSISVSELQNKVKTLRYEIGSLMLPYQATYDAVKETIDKLTNTKAALEKQLLDFRPIPEPEKPLLVNEPVRPEMSQAERTLVSAALDVSKKRDGLSAKIEALRASLKPCEKCGHSANLSIIDTYEAELAGLDSTIIAKGQQISDNFRELERIYDTHKITYDRYLRQIAEYSRLMTEYSVQDEKLNTTKQRLSEIAADLEQLKYPEKPDTSGLAEEIESCLSLCRKIEADNKPIEEEYEAYSFWNTQLSVKGVKEYAFGACINELNQHFVKFCPKKATIAYEKGQIRLDLFNDNVEFGDLSGGEQQIIELSLALALHSMAKNKFKTNLLILDEPFTNLDVQVSATIKDMVAGISESVYIITHTPIDQVGINLIEI